MTDAIRPGSRVTLHYTLSLPDGRVVDTTADGAPASFVVGSGDLVEVLERRLLGLVPGERRHFELSATDSGIGSDPGALQRMARTDFPAELELRPGEVIGFELPDGQEVPGFIVAVTDEEVAVDFSHPLAGRELIFDVEILAVESA